MHPEVLSNEMNLVLQLQGSVNLNNKVKLPEFIAQTNVMSGAPNLLPLSQKVTRLILPTVHCVH